MKSILLLDVGNPLYREFALASLARQAPVVLVGTSLPEWAKCYVTHWIDIDPEQVDEIAAQVEQRGIDLFMVVTYYEFYVEAVALLSARFGLRGNSLDTARMSRDKRLMRDAFARHDVSSPVSVLAMTDEEIVTAARQIGFPVVIKPRKLAGSIGVVLAQTEQALQAAIKARQASEKQIRTRSAIMHETLVETYVDVPEISVESVVVDGEVNIVAVTQKRLGPPPYFEEIGHLVSFEPGGQELPPAVVVLVIAAHRALSVQWGITHTEIRLGKDGAKVIELATRAGGDQILKLVELASGLDLFKLLVDGFRGVPLDLRSTRHRVAAIDFIYPPRAGVLDKIQAAEILQPAGITSQLVVEAAIGSTLEVPPQAFLDRAAFIITQADTVHACIAASTAHVRGIQVVLK
ncbi:ATP-grasp domain-containing protein [Pseudomonas agarici]|uniref:ATP-grasp domain-containing protein n=1 Tax=Pseudomonas agarici TaxID=46677 RepID=UPI0002EECDF6|nr:ATP-grasp domain-containing protein [Pseudomonas agarici]NWC11105.1 ATP-grasp domain-containing protein [Pseudomonas agarici]SEL58560.1 Biotin carboxylase [Pseudomonas agarici]